MTIVTAASSGDHAQGDPTTRRDKVNIRRSFVRFVALTVVVAMPVMGMSGIASAKSAKAAAAKCAKHPNRAKCQNSGGGSSSGGTGGAPVQITVTASPNPL